ncbi:DNRLRE domain-containing protein [Peterkaempfera bronchialis]|uniref:DNRLRE domain-containing protein n=1 Tax=Peterkaempfera bronchialis TaxID=2126346 RepID=UPI0013B3E927|nr:DNRLRE domain-containing protein [Peterkaempfera bronchialis]
MTKHRFLSSAVGGLAAPRRLASVAVVTSLALLIGLGEPIEPSSAKATAAPSESAPAKTAPAEAPDAASALLAARLQDRRIEITGERTDSTTSWANPDGTTTVESYTGPIRVLDEHGTWRPVDTTLVEADGTVQPAMAAADMSFSGGGGKDGTLAQLTRGKHTLGLGWEGRLPQPTLDGPTATYPNAVPGGDLVVTALKEGFSHSVVLRKRPDGPVEYRLPVTATGLRLRETSDKRLSWEDSNGKATATAPAPMMWDSSTDKVSGDPKHLAPIDVTIEASKDGKGQVLVLKPDPTFLADPDLTYPVTIDPTDSLMGAATDTWLQYDDYQTSQRASTELKAGTYDGTHKARSFLKFTVTKYTGKHVLDAKLRLYSYYSSTCDTKNSGVEVRRITADWDPAAITWSKQPATTATGATVIKDAKGYNASSCPGGFNTWDLTAITQAWADGQPNYGVRLAAVSETDVLTWRRYHSANYVDGSHDPNSEPSLTVTYNTKPGVVTPLSPLDGTFTNATKPTISGKSVDADGNTVQLTFEIWKSDGTAALMSGKSAFVASGATASWVPSTALTEGAYKWRATVTDGTDANGTWSAWQNFTVDITKPGAPFVTSADYPSDGLWHGGSGQAGKFSFTPASGTSDLAAYVYSLDAAAPETVSATGGATVSITPSADGHRSLKVQAKDKAGNLSNATVYEFLVGRGAISSPQDGASSARRVKLQVDAQAQYTRVTYQWRRGPGAAQYDVPLANLTKADNTPVTDVKARLSDLGGHANWSVLETLGQIGGIVEVRAVLYTNSDADPSYATEWRRFTVDPNADGAASDDMGPGSVNLLTGDYSVSVADADEFGLASTRVASSRGTDRGWQAQGERLTANQQQVSTNTAGFVASNATISRDTTLGQDGSTDSLKVVPAASGTTSATSARLDSNPDSCLESLCQGMKPGHTYRASAWAYVPAATGLSPDDSRGLRIVASAGTSGALKETKSRAVPYTDAWAELTVDFTLPADATIAHVRLWNGFAAGSGKAVYFDHLSLRELVAPFGKEWAGGAEGGPTDNDYVALAFPGKDVAVIVADDDTTLSFAKGSGNTFTPEPGAEGLTLALKTDATPNYYALSDIDGTVTTFKQQSGSDLYMVSTVSGTDADSTVQYTYDVSDGRTLVKRVIGQVEAGVDDAGQCKGATPARGCEVLEYLYATTTTATATTPGDYTDRVKTVRVWSWDPDATAETAVEVASYRYDGSGRLVEVWDPRKAGASDSTAPLKTTYGYDSAGRLTGVNLAGELPWSFDYGKAGADQDPGRLLKVRRAALVPGTRDQVSGETASTVVYEVPLTRAAGGPYDLGGATVGTWAQTDAPTDATAVFDVEDDPGTSTATSVKPGRDGYKPATVHYLDASGQEVNTATWSPTGLGDISTTEYDQFGNAVRSLDASGRLLALGAGPDAEAYAAELGLPEDSAARAALLDSRTVYSSDGVDVLEELGPSFRANLSEAVAGQSSPTKVTAEGEGLVQLGSTAPLKVENNGCCAVTWSGTGQILLQGTKSGDNATFRISVPEEGDYRLTSTLTKAKDYGIAQLSIDGQNIGGTFDGYSATTATAAFNPATPISLQRGDHELTVTVVGRNAAAVSPYYQAGIDVVALTKTTANPALPAGTSVVVRDHTVHAYDEGKPDGAAYHLETTTYDGARLAGYPTDVEVRVTKTGYGTPIGGTSGWVLRTATSVTTDAASGGANLTASLKYDAAGRVVESRRPGSNGADTGTVKTVFYTAGSNPDDAACGNRPEWAGNPCATLPGGAVTGADSARMPTTLPVKRITRYSRHGDVEETTETNAGKTRKTVTAYDATDRVLSTQITSDQGQALPPVTTEYDPATGNAVKTTAGGKTISRVFDALDRLLSYTDADGSTTTTQFDKFGKPVKVTDNTGSTTYTYDRAAEPRGFVTSVTDSVAGTFGAHYGADGQLTELTYPGGIKRTDTFNAAGAATDRTYIRTSDDAVVFGEHLELTTQGAIGSDSSSVSDKEFTYDRLGRLTQARQTTAADGCTTRRYGYDEAGRSIAGRMDRTSKITYPATADGACATANGVTENHSYDSADRLLDAGYTYDAFGRTTATGTGSANTYWANDLVATQTVGSTRQSWTVDPAHRFAAFTTEAKQADGSWANASSKLNHYGDDSDEPRWIIEDTTQGTLTRNVTGPDGDLTATTSATGDIQLQFTDLHGDVVITADPALETPQVLTFDEFGIPTAGQGTTRYGWLGGKQRSAEALDGVILMGVRLYSPALGRFLQTDPEPGGNANAYDYCTGDPVNCTDLDGNWGFHFKKVFSRVAKVAEYASYIPGPIGNVASAVSAVSYAATGNWRKAAEMSVGIALGAAGKVAVKAFKAANTIRKASRVQRFASRARTVVRRSGCNSFAPDTPVLMADGSYLSIADVQVGDYVTATDPVTGATYAEPVLDVITGYGTKHLIEIDTDLDPTTPPLEATANHPIWVTGRGWTDAVDVRPGDRLLSPLSGAVVVTGVRDRGMVSDQLVVNLNVGDVHTYVVAVGDEDILVHNRNAQCRIDLKHVLAGHGSTSRVAGKSRFRSRNIAEVRHLIRTTIKKGKSRPNTDGREGRIYEHEFGRRVGRNTKGKPTKRVRVVVTNGRVRTAHPY